MVIDRFVLDDVVSRYNLCKFRLEELGLDVLTQPESTNELDALTDGFRFQDLDLLVALPVDHPRIATTSRLVEEPHVALEARATIAHAQRFEALG